MIEKYFLNKSPSVQRIKKNMTHLTTLNIKLLSHQRLYQRLPSCSLILQSFLLVHIVRLHFSASPPIRCTHVTASRPMKCIRWGQDTLHHFKYIWLTVFSVFLRALGSAWRQRQQRGNTALRLRTATLQPLRSASYWLSDLGQVTLLFCGSFPSLQNMGQDKHRAYHMQGL